MFFRSKAYLYPEESRSIIMKKSIDVFNFSFVNSADDSVDIHIDGEIVDAATQQVMRDWWGDETSVSFKSFRDEIVKSQAKTLNVFINSYGGHVGDAMAIHDLLVDLQNQGKTVNTKGRGIIASAATYILMAGKNSEMSKNSWFMIHNVSGAVWGDVNIVENYARSLRKFNDATRDFYAESTGIPKENITKMMNAETWMTAAEAQAKGFVKSVSGGATFTNSIPKENWHFENRAVLNAYNSSVTPPKMSNAVFQNTLAAAQAESFEVVDGGFLLSEQMLNSIDARISDLHADLESARNEHQQAAEAHAARETEIQTLEAANLQLTGELEEGIAERERLQAEINRLNNLTPAPAAGPKPEDKFNDDPTAKYLTSVDAEMAKLRAMRTASN